MTRSRPQYRIEHDKPMISRIQSIKADHPLWGYRRVWAYMRIPRQRNYWKKQSLSTYVRVKSID